MMQTPSPSPVVVVVNVPGDRGWIQVLTVLGVLATVVAAWLAWLAIRRSGQAAGRASRELLADRAATFHLGLLERLAVALETGASPGRNLEVITSLRMLDDCDMPTARATFGVDATDQGLARLEALRNEARSGAEDDDLTFRARLQNLLSDEWRLELADAVVRRTSRVTIS